MDLSLEGPTAVALWFVTEITQIDSIMEKWAQTRTLHYQYLLVTMRAGCLGWMISNIPFHIIKFTLAINDFRLSVWVWWHTSVYWNSYIMHN